MATVDLHPAAPKSGLRRIVGNEPADVDTNSTHVGKYDHAGSAHARVCRSEEGGLREDPART